MGTFFGLLIALVLLAAIAYQRMYVLFHRRYPRNPNRSDDH